MKVRRHHRLESIDWLPAWVTERSNSSRMPMFVRVGPELTLALGFARWPRPHSAVGNVPTVSSTSNRCETTNVVHVDLRRSVGRRSRSTCAEDDRRKRWYSIACCSTSISRRASRERKRHTLELINQTMTHSSDLREIIKHMSEMISPRCLFLSFHPITIIR